MNIPPYFPAWMYLYFALFGSVALILVALIFWTWMKSTPLAKGFLKIAQKWNIAGYFFLFCAVWFACGIGAGPGFLLSTDPTMHKPLLAAGAAMLGMLSSVIGWACLLVAQQKILKGLQSYAEDQGEKSMVHS